jgi:hypothetical protein
LAYQQTFPDVRVMPALAIIATKKATKKRASRQLGSAVANASFLPTIGWRADMARTSGSVRHGPTADIGAAFFRCPLYPR